MNTEQKDFLDQYLQTLPEAQRHSHPKVIAEYFCADEYNANECAKLILQQKKRASCSLKAAYDIEGEPLPEVGRLTIVLDWDENPVCIVRLYEVSICPFNQVTREFAEAEGEGDGSYEWWRQAHLDFFTEYSQELGLGFSEDSDLVLERFSLVFPVSAQPGPDWVYTDRR